VSISRRTFAFVALALFVWAFCATLVAGYYYYSYSDLYVKTRVPAIQVNLGINYGNGTVQWFNETEARSGDTLLDVTKQVATANYTDYGYGSLVNSINDVNSTSSEAWIWWIWNQQFGWSQGPVASDKYVLGNNETVYWYYQDISAWPYSSPP